MLDASGNVIGMTVSGMMEGDVSMGLNYFIPIGEAMAALRIGESVHEARQPETAVPPMGAEQSKKPIPAALGAVAIRGAMGAARSPESVGANVVGIATDKGTGAGFLVDGNGHLIANAQLIGSAKRIDVRLADGRSVRGKAVQRNDQLSLALVQLEALPAGDGLLVQPLLPAVGSGVYVVGSPLDAGGPARVTKGIVQDIRQWGGYEFVQTDIDVAPSGTPLLDPLGNVVGVAAPGLVANGPSFGANTFLSIRDALAALGIGASS